MNFRRSQRVIAIVLLWMSVAVNSSATIFHFDFDIYDDGFSLTSEYQGLNFANATVLKAGLSLNELAFPPHSGDGVLFDDGGPITIVFSTPARSISGYFTYLNGLTLSAYDSNNNLLASVTSSNTTNLADGAGALGSSANELLGLSSANDLIASVVISASNTGGSLVMDDLTVITSGTALPVPDTLSLLFLGLVLAWLQNGQVVKTFFSVLLIRRSKQEAFPQRLPKQGASVQAIHTAALSIAILGTFLTSQAGAGVLGRPALSPLSVVVDTLASVRFTVSIEDAAFIVGSANVQRLNKDGSPQAIVGVLRDDGTQGDAIANDQIYTMDLPLKEVNAGAVAFRVSAAYKGELKRTLSPAFLLTVLPSTPGPALEAPALNIASIQTGIAVIGLASVRVKSDKLPTSLVLQKVDEANRVVASLGSLHDDGADGDLLAVDNIYSVRTTILADSPGIINYRMAATFPGDGQTTYSDTFTLAITGIGTSINLTSPASGAYLSTPVITVAGKLGDPGAQVTLNGIPAVLSGTTFNAAVPLNEGPNTVTAVATNSGGTTSTSSILVTLDTTAPKIEIYSPAANVSTGASSVNVSGMVNDIVVGTVNPQQAAVIVNGVKAEVLNRTFLARDVPLNIGPNTLQAIVTDRAGNRATTSAKVLRLESPNGLMIMSGNNQRGPAGGILAAPLVVRLTNAQGAPLVNKPIVFRVIGLDGTVALAQTSASGLAATAVNTNSEGKAWGYYKLGLRAGAGNLVEASSAGVQAAVDFVATGTSGIASAAVVDSGNNQTGVIGQPLPFPFIAVVTDANHNRLADVPVKFEIKAGGGGFGPEGRSFFQTTSDSDGRVAATLILGPDPGVTNNIVAASFAGNTGYAAAFTASGMIPGPAALTRISGVVLDNSNNPIPGVTMRLLQITQGNRSNIPQEMAAAVRTNAQGQFVMQPAAVGIFKLMADGGTATRPGTWPTLDFDFVTISGQNNTLGMPIFLPELNPNNRVCVDENTGGTLTLPDVPGFALTVLPGSATFPGGSRSGCISATPVNIDKVPMAPGFGQQPRFVVTIQPVGTHFSPAASMTIPNVDGLAPRAVTEMYSYDHDLASFVAIGSATVSPDGSTITSDLGAGVIKAGWHSGGNPTPTGSAGTCPACQRCEGSACVPVADSAQTPPPKQSPTPSIVDDTGDAVSLKQFGANIDFDYETALSCKKICTGGVEKYVLEGDVTPDAEWRVAIHTRAQVPNCAAITRTATNIARTRVHELKHATLLMSVINNSKKIIGTHYGSMENCQKAKDSSEEQLNADWNQMTRRQALHTDFVGEMRYTFICKDGRTFETPAGIEYEK